MHTLCLLSRVAGYLVITLLAACATTPPQKYTPPAPDAPAADVQLHIMLPSRNRSAALYLRGAVKCASPGLESFLNRTVEEPAMLVAGSWENRFMEVVRLPAGIPLSLRFHYQGPGEDWDHAAVVLLKPGARYVFDHEIPGRSFTLTDSTTGQAAPRLPARWFHSAMLCPS